MPVRLYIIIGGLFLAGITSPAMAAQAPNQETKAGIHATTQPDMEHAGPVSETAVDPDSAQTDKPETSSEEQVEKGLTVLGKTDIALYKRIFEVQRAGHWSEADKLIHQLKNKVLMGHVLYQRYMHPTAYRSSYAELSSWMAEYPDLPAADNIYSLAQKRRPENGNPLLPPVSDTQREIVVEKPTPPLPTEPEDEAESPGPSLTFAERREIARVKSIIYSYLRRGRPDRAEKHLWAAHASNVLSKPDFAKTLANVASSYYYVGKNEKALALANISAPQLRALSSQADWIGGLSAWRLGKYDEAAKHFEYVAKDMSASRWTVSAGAFWAARAYLACHKPEKVNGLLRQAATYTRTFYGLVAARQLGQKIDLSWDLPPLTYKQLKPMLDIPGIQRTIALAQVGQVEKADLELRLVWQRYAPDLHEPLLGLASRLNLPSTQVKVAKALGRQLSTPIDSALYPMPDWQPAGGYSLDRALIFAFMRQESEFNPQAKSVAGAVGLMQLMPQTASYISRDRSLRYGNNPKLLRPDFNMKLGQRYIEYLLDKDISSGNLFLVASAYNGGPGNVSRWVRKNNFNDDPLLYIESIPLDETRDFVVRVISNMWIYQMRIGHKTPTLDDVAAGKWPMYQAMDIISQNDQGIPDDKAAPHARN